MNDRTLKALLLAIAVGIWLNAGIERDPIPWTVSPRWFLSSGFKDIDDEWIHSRGGPSGK
jgi:hypothetical protein